MILVDSNIVIERMRMRDLRTTALFDSLPLAVCGVVRAEVLSGARSATERNRCLQLLDTLIQISTVETDWNAIGGLRAMLFQQGLSLGLPDVAIAGVAILNGLPLWSRDRAHRQMAAVVPALTLFQESP